MNNQSILIINDIAGYGRVSSIAMIEVFSSYGYHPYILPTALVSNTTDYGSCEILDTTQFMSKTISKWRSFGFSFNYITTGLINSYRQCDIICDLIDTQDHPFVMVDPVMADHGEMYSGIFTDAASCYRKLALRADVLIPNYTEATILTGIFTDRHSLSAEEYSQLVSAVRELTAGSVVITGCRDNDGKYFNLAYDRAENRTERIYFEHIDKELVGTGDVFSACLLSACMEGKNIFDSVRSAAYAVRHIVDHNIDCDDPNDIHIECVLNNTNL